MIDKINNLLVRPVSPIERTKQTEEESEEQAQKRRENESKKENNPVENGEIEKDSDGHRKIDIKI